jgi:predicted nucleic acid-binding Zn ribbon protein
MKKRKDDMPLFTYKCDTCDREADFIRKFEDQAPIPCAEEGVPAPASAIEYKLEVAFSPKGAPAAVYEFDSKEEREAFEEGYLAATGDFGASVYLKHKKSYEGIERNAGCAGLMTRSTEIESGHPTKYKWMP